LGYRRPTLLAPPPLVRSLRTRREALRRRTPAQPREVHARSGRPRALHVHRQRRRGRARGRRRISLGSMGRLQDLLPLPALTDGQDHSPRHRAGRL